MAWCSWTAANRCPACGGHRWAGRSAQQCRGGFNDERPLVVYCSVEDSGKPSSSGVTFEWWLDEPYPWRDEPARESKPRFMQEPHELPPGLRAGRHWRPIAEWQYHYPGRGYCYSVIRFESDDGEKSYRSGVVERNPPPYRKAKRYRWGLEPDERIPYRLPELLSGIAAGRPVWVVEGEKSADALVALGEVATTNPGGSAQWNALPEPTRWFAGATDIRIVADRDAAGESWARDVAKSLAPLGASIRLFRSRTVNPGDDVADHLNAGFALADLEEQGERS